MKSLFYIGISFTVASTIILLGFLGASYPVLARGMSILGGAVIVGLLMFALVAITCVLAELGEDATGKAIARAAAFPVAGLVGFLVFSGLGIWAGVGQ